MARVTVAKVGDIQEGSGFEVEVEGKKIGVFHTGGTYYAIDNNCTHVDAPLTDGTIEGKQVVCPWHGAKFDLTTGEALCPPAGASVACYAVHLEGDEIQIEVS